LQSLTRLTKVLQSSLNFQAYFFSIIKNKLSSRSVHKLNPITHTKHSRRKFRNCSAFDWPNSSFYFFFWTRLVSHWWWNSTPSDMCRQSFPNNFALIEITQTLCVPLSRVLFDHIHIIYVCNPTTVKRDLFPSAFVIFLSRPMKSPHGT